MAEPSMVPGESPEEESARRQRSQAQSSPQHGGANVGIALANQPLLRQKTIRNLGRIEGHLQNFSEVKRVTSSALRDLLATTESIRDDEPVRWRFPDCGQKFEFANGRGDVVLVVLEAEGASHSATSWGGSLEIDADAAQQRLLGSHFHDGLVMTVSVQQRLALEAREWRVAGVVFEKLAEQKRLPRERLRALVVREEVEQFVAENGDTARLKSDYRDSRFNLGRKCVEDFEEQRLRSVEHAEVIQWTTTTEIRLRKDHPVSRGFEDIDRGFRSCGQEIVVKRVGPEQNRRALRG